MDSGTKATDRKPIISKLVGSRVAAILGMYLATGEGRPTRENVDFAVRQNKYRYLRTARPIHSDFPV